MKIGEMVATGRRAYVHLESHCSVQEAVERLQKENVRALIVTEQQRPVGIFAERDVLRVYLRNRSMDFERIILKEVMSPKLITAEAGDSVAETMNIMLKADIHHLPVIDNENIIALLTLYDLVQYRVKILEQELNDLKDYIGDLHEASLD